MNKRLFDFLKKNGGSLSFEHNPRFDRIEFVYNLPNNNGRVSGSYISRKALENEEYMESLWDKVLPELERAIEYSD